MPTFERQAEALLARAGITINGPAPTDIQILGNPQRLFRRVFWQGKLGVGESFMEGEWDVKDLTGFVTLLQRSQVHDSVEGVRTLARFLLQALFSYRQSKKRGRQVAIEHYNMDNYLFQLMLDKLYTMYTCGLYRSGATTIEEAQTAKCELSCRKLKLRPGHRILDVGSGFSAGFLRYVVTNYEGVTGVGIVNSEEQAKLSRECVKGLPIEIRFGDYRDLDGEFDRIVSMGMLEHVGPGNYVTYFKKMRSLLRDDGLALIHWIASHETELTCDPWFNKYIFPNGVAGSLGQIAKAVEGFFVCEDVDNFGANYDPTLQAWYENLAANWSKLEGKYGNMDGRTFRMMKYYLLGVAGGFRSRIMQLYQVVLSPHGVPGGYMPVR